MEMFFIGVFSTICIMIIGEILIDIFYGWLVELIKNHSHICHHATATFATTLMDETIEREIPSKNKTKAPKKKRRK